MSTLLQRAVSFVSFKFYLEQSLKLIDLTADLTVDDDIGLISELKCSVLFSREFVVLRMQVLHRLWPVFELVPRRMRGDLGGSGETRRELRVRGL